MENNERFRPIAHHAPAGLVNTVLFYIRLLVDFQFCTIYRQIKKILPFYKGNVLDVGCGNSPFRFLVNNTEAKYIGIDIADADNFDYNNSEKISFDGENIPFENNSIDNIIATEVLEHIEKPEKIISEMYRVLKPNGKAFITIPWSARVHYAPYDFCRYTPFKLEKLFSQFQSVDILNRGTDINSIVAKIVVVCFGLFLISGHSPHNNLIINKLLGRGGNVLKQICKWIVAVITLPLFLIAVAVGQLELLFKLGSANDPLGYTVILKK
jgi:SAM-dependent methyltransferase